MMTNLFSIFDPSSGFISMNWMISLIAFLIFFQNQMKTSKYSILLNSFCFFFTKDIKPLMSAKSKNLIKLYSIMFLFLAISNLMSLFPFNFTITSQISFSFTMSLTYWTSIQLMGWLKYTNSMMSHLVPQGTPKPLKPLMIIIEIISQLIRPITLSVRLSANMIAGHLLLSLLGDLSISSKMMFLFSMPLSMILSFLEICVSLIQAYVFMTLVSLYSTEIN
uniref:ATP synthase F0 subunit 6 n=1 Tax=Hygrobates turcicus TaxID=2028090 RepID=UPI002237A65F|nr:ATP synthase F0 subunit 6 [Hygrobates turcicus]UYS90924.1 ATP synthase F0 subunit 6 [Hygrobates turcicus]